MTHRIGDWIATYSGKKFWPLDPRPEEVDIEDIAHALSMKCRYGGHSRLFYSVAQHSVLMAQAAVEKTGSVDLAKWCLLHDAAEAYTTDVPAPIKPHLGFQLPHPVPRFISFSEAETTIREAIRRAIAPELRFYPPRQVHDLDQRILVDEAAELMTDSSEWVNRMGPGLGVKIESWSPVAAKEAFLASWEFLKSDQNV